jgi:cytochrome c oxidase subunit 4
MSNHDTHAHHAADPKKEALTYTATLVALLILTGITFGASYVNFGSSSANIAVALIIASIKATLVALIFMHVLHEKPLTGIMAIAGFLFLGIFLTFVLLDIGARRDTAPQRMPPTVTEPATATPAPAAAKKE